MYILYEKLNQDLPINSIISSQQAFIAILFLAHLRLKRRNSFSFSVPSIWIITGIVIAFSPCFLQIMAHEAITVFIAPFSVRVGQQFSPLLNRCPHFLSTISTGTLEAAGFGMKLSSDQQMSESEVVYSWQYWLRLLREIFEGFANLLAAMGRRKSTAGAFPEILHCSVATGQLWMMSLHCTVICACGCSAYLI